MPGYQGLLYCEANAICARTSWVVAVHILSYTRKDFDRVVVAVLSAPCSGIEVRDDKLGFIGFQGVCFSEW